MSSLEITEYYRAVNELAAMLADGEIGVTEWRIQRAIMAEAWHRN